MKSFALKLITLLLILVWVYAGTSKLLDYEQSRIEMLSQVFPQRAARVLTWLVPVTELIAAGLLAIVHTRKAGLMISAFLLCLFTLYAALVLLNFFAQIPCTCGGILKYMSWKQHLAFNTFLLAMALSAIGIHPKKGGRVTD